MSKYELVNIVNASLTQEDKDAVLKEAADIVSKSGGKVINSQTWLEKHKLTFEIKKCTHGTYYIINFECTPVGITKIDKALKLNERILRFLIVKSEK